MDTNRSIISATDISREFKTGDTVLAVLKGISLEVARGEMVAVTGASGVGKSTLMHILGGLDRPTGGTVRLGGIELSSRDDRERARLRNNRVGFVFQHHYLMEDFSALENVMIPRMVAGATPGDAGRRGELLLKQVGLKDRTSHRPNQLSGGEQQRVAVARALANDPDVVLADEPSGNLDTATGRMLHELLHRLNMEGALTLVIATHNRELAEMCHREMKIVDGHITEVARSRSE